VGGSLRLDLVETESVVLCWLLYDFVVGGLLRLDLVET
jgi:hypothetical protein